jgi:hypothetical protein
MVSPMARQLTISLIAVTALALLGAGSASATKLCTDESCKTVYAAGTAISSTLSGSAEFIVGSEILGTCTESTVKAKTASKEGETVPLSVESLTWGKCTHPTKTAANGEMSIESISATKNGTVRGKGMKVTVLAFGFIDCIYGTGSGFISLGKLTGGSEPILAVEAKVLRLEGAFCPETATWKATYTVTEPHALFVAGLEPSLKVTPAGEKTMKVNETLTVTVENNSMVPVFVNSEKLEGPFEFTAGPCSNMELAPEESCATKIECMKAGEGEISFEPKLGENAVLFLKCD